MTWSNHAPEGEKKQKLGAILEEGTSENFIELVELTHTKYPPEKPDEPQVGLTKGNLHLDSS